MKKLISGIIMGLALAGCGPSGGSGGITFSPATESCSNLAALTETIQLPSSVKAADTISETLDGKQLLSPAVVTSVGSQKSDGSWTATIQSNVAELQPLCAAGGAWTSPGTHTVQVLDSSGKVLAQGSYSVTK